MSVHWPDHVERSRQRSGAGTCRRAWSRFIFITERGARKSEEEAQGLPSFSTTVGLPLSIKVIHVIPGVDENCGGDTA